MAALQWKWRENEVWQAGEEDATLLDSCNSSYSDEGSDMKDFCSFLPSLFSPTFSVPRPSTSGKQPLLWQWRHFCLPEGNTSHFPSDTACITSICGALTWRRQWLAGWDSSHFLYGKACHLWWACQPRSCCRGCLINNQADNVSCFSKIIRSGKRKACSSSRCHVLNTTS